MNNKANNLSVSQTPNKPSKANQTEPNREANRAANAEQTTQFQCSPPLGHGRERVEEGEEGWCCANNTKSDLSVDQLTLRVIKTTTRRLRFSLRCHLQLPSLSLFLSLSLAHKCGHTLRMRNVRFNEILNFIACVPVNNLPASPVHGHVHCLTSPSTHTTPRPIPLRNLSLPRGQRASPPPPSLLI